MGIGKAIAPVLVFGALLCAAQPALAQFTQQGPKLVGTGAVGVAEQGYSVALSADGNTAIVGGAADNALTGAAWVFTRSGGVWSQQGPKLVGSGAVGAAEQGISVALSGRRQHRDRGRACRQRRHRSGVGLHPQRRGVEPAGREARRQRRCGSRRARLLGRAVRRRQHRDRGRVCRQRGAGAAWVFTRSGGVWSQQGAKLVGTGVVGAAGQGSSVALSADGNTAIVGGFGDNANTGATWVFTRSGGVWSQQGAKLVGSGAVGAAVQGYSVALSGDGNTAIVGGLGDNAATGATWVFTRSGGVWTQQGLKLVGSGAVGAAQQGHSVALSANGNTAIVGGNTDNASTGAAWVFTRSGGVWSQQGAKLVGTGAVGAAFQGYSVALSAAGTTAIAGGPVDSGGSGAAWVFAAPNFNPSATHDFNGDGFSDVLWLDTTHDVGMWLMNGATILKGVVFNSVPAQWSVVGQRDFNGDGFADILWRDNVGNVGMWLMNGTTIVQAGSFSSIPTQWSVAGTGDFNGDGKADILWIDTSNNLGIWFMNGTTITRTAVVGQLPANWIVVGSDMKGDVFLRNTATGDVGIWVMNGAQVAQSVDLGPVSLNWTVAGIGDFDSNGSTDLLWRDTAGDVAIWLMNGTTIASSTVLNNLPLSWTIGQTGDYNGDGKSDILWVDNTGNVGIWFMNATSVASVSFYGNLGTNWSVQSLGAD